MSNTTYDFGTRPTTEYNGIQLSRDSYSLGLMAPLLCGHPYLAFSASSLRPFCLNHILNDIIVNNRTRIIEFGSGISTMMIGRLIKKNKLNVSLVSIDHDEQWVKKLRADFKREEIANVTLIHAPLTKCHLALNENEWYDLDKVDVATTEGSFDLVIIDGPPAWESPRQLARYPALPFIFDNLSKDSAIYLDDANRNGEQIILRTWREKFNLSFNILGGTLAVARRGRAFDTVPCKW